jgi:hypothetical protein
MGKEILEVVVAGRGSAPMRTNGVMVYVGSARSACRFRLYHLHHRDHQLVGEDEHEHLRHHNNAFRYH